MRFCFLIFTFAQYLPNSHRTAKKLRQVYYYRILGFKLTNFNGFPITKLLKSLHPTYNVSNNNVLAFYSPTKYGLWIHLSFLTIFLCPPPTPAVHYQGNIEHLGYHFSFSLPPNNTAHIPLLYLELSVLSQLL